MIFLGAKFQRFDKIKEGLLISISVAKCLCRKIVDKFYNFYAQFIKFLGIRVNAYFFDF